MVKEIEIEGKIFSGRGEGAMFMELPGVREEIEEKLGFTPYPGTLNLRLPEGERHKKVLLEKTGGRELSLKSNFYTGIVFEGRLIGRVKCGIVIPQTPDYPEDHLEVIASVRLRDKFNLEDGDPFKVEILMS
ncbi:MAG: DUF120 domain-containing protein [Thermoproteota archaeon]